MNITNERVKLNTAPIKFWFGQCMKYDIYHTINWCVFNERQHIWYPVGNIGSKNNYHILSHLINTLFLLFLFVILACGLWRFIAFGKCEILSNILSGRKPSGEALAFNYNQVLHHITLLRYERKKFGELRWTEKRQLTLCICCTSLSVTDATFSNWAFVWWSVFFFAELFVFRFQQSKL